MAPQTFFGRCHSQTKGKVDRSSFHAATMWFWANKNTLFATVKSCTLISKISKLLRAFLYAKKKTKMLSWLVLEFVKLFLINVVPPTLKTKVYIICIIWNKWKQKREFPPFCLIWFFLESWTGYLNSFGRIKQPKQRIGEVDLSKSCWTKSHLIISSCGWKCTQPIGAQVKGHNVQATSSRESRKNEWYLF